MVAYGLPFGTHLSFFKIHLRTIAPIHVIFRLGMAKYQVYLRSILDLSMESYVTNLIIVIEQYSIVPDISHSTTHLFARYQLS